MLGTRTDRIGLGVALTLLAGVAAGVGGCSSTKGQQAERFQVTPRPETPVQQQPVAQVSQQPSFNGNGQTQTVSFETPNTGDGGPPTGWAMGNAAANAERQNPMPTPAVADGPTTEGPNLAAHLYGQILGTEIPGMGEEIGRHTINIRQISFAHDGSEFDPEFSKDGEYLVFSSTQHAPTADVYIKKVGSRVLTRLTDDPGQDVMPALSPDGKRIAFASNRNGTWDLWVMPAEGGKAVQITSDMGHDLHPSWSPDGQHVVFSKLGATSGRWELWVADVFDNTAARFIGYGLFPEWCPVAGTGFGGSDQILFQRSRDRGDRTFGIWTIDFNRNTQQAGHETQIASHPDAALINPSWSPDAQRIVYSAVPNPEKWTGQGSEAVPPSAAIWMVGIDGLGEVPLTSGTSIDMMPVWGPDGQIVFVSDRSGVENLWAVDVAPAIYAATGENPYEDQRPVVTVPTDEP